MFVGRPPRQPGLEAYVVWWLPPRRRVTEGYGPALCARWSDPYYADDLRWPPALDRCCRTIVPSPLDLARCLEALLIGCSRPCVSSSSCEPAMKPVGRWSRSLAMPSPCRGGRTATRHGTRCRLASGGVVRWGGPASGTVAEGEVRPSSTSLVDWCWVVVTPPGW